MDNTLFLAHVSTIDIAMPGGSLNMIFVAYKPTQEEARAAIHDAVGELATIEFREHELPVDETVQRLGLRDGSARSLA